jgi:hypothetical protein
MMDTYQAQDLFVESVGITAFKKRPELIALLRKNGVKVADDISERDLISITLVACAKSSTCRADLTAFLTENIAEEQLGYVQEDFFNQIGTTSVRVPASALVPKTAAPPQTDKKKKGIFTKKEGGTAAGNFLRSEQGKQTINTALNAGISLLFKDKKGAEANQTVQQATDQAQAAADQNRNDNRKRGWVLPAIIGGVVVIGVVIYFATRKKK